MITQQQLISSILAAIALGLPSAFAEDLSVGSSTLHCTAIARMVDYDHSIPDQSIELKSNEYQWSAATTVQQLHGTFEHKNLGTFDITIETPSFGGFYGNSPEANHVSISIVQKPGSTPPPAPGSDVIETVHGLSSKIEIPVVDDPISLTANIGTFGFADYRLIITCQKK